MNAPKRTRTYYFYKYYAFTTKHKHDANKIHMGNILL